MNRTTHNHANVIAQRDEPDIHLASEGSADRVLLLAPTGRDAVLAAETLRASGIHATLCPDMGSLTRSIAEGADVALIAQEALTPPELDSLTRTLERQPSWSDLPLIIFTGSGRSSEAGDMMLLVTDRLGNATLLERPLRIATLVRAVRVALRARRRQYEIREHLKERERAASERIALAEQQRTFLRDVLASVTEGKLRLCDSAADLPKRFSGMTEPLELTRRSLRDLRRETLAVAKECGLSEERADDLVTSVNEAGMNAVVHGGGGVAYIGCESVGSGADDAATVQVWIIDQGTGIDMSHLPQATLERGYSSAGTFGHGFWMMLKATDRTYLLTGPTGTTVVIEQNRIVPSPSWMANDY